jgi:ABC-type branched-subunit amino acid transport system substrate-binding protein
MIGASLLVLVVLIVGAVFAIPRLGAKQSNSTASASPISVQKIGSELIGISDGSTIFDANRPDGSLKQQAADKLKGGDTGGALSLFNEAVATESNDGEALIYGENLRIAASPHITFVAGAMPSGSADIVGVSRDALQGAYLAQKEFNDGGKLPGGLKVRLLIASSGGSAKNATLVAQQIVRLAKFDATFVGVMGWPYSGLTFAAAQVLGQAQIPMVSSTASADSLTGISSYFFRVAPSNKAQGIAGAKYAESLGAKNVAIFLDTSNLYSQSLGNDFKQQFEADGGKTSVTDYTVGKPDTLQSALTKAVLQSPDLLYFSGYAADVTTLFKDMTAAGAPATLKVLGGDALYELSGYNGASPAERSRLRFTTFSFPDEWDIAGIASQKPAFFSEYPSAFSAGKKGYGFDRPTNQSMLSYDAMSALLKAAASGQAGMKPTDLQQALQKTVFQGASGYIKFGSDGNPINKAFVVLKVSPQGFTQMEKVIGSLTTS